LDAHQYLPFIPMLLDRNKIIKTDITWKKMCDDLGWLFIESV